MTQSERAKALHRGSIVIDGCSFHATRWDERLERAGVTSLQMTVVLPLDDLSQAVRRYAEYYHVVAAEPRFMVIETAEDVRRCKREGKVGFILGTQNATMLEDDPCMVEVFYRLGTRVVQLSYNERNLLADGCAEPTNAGLSRFGKAVIHELNRTGIVIDLTHVGERSSLDAIEASTKPCIFSHSNPRARVENQRNISDAQIDACAEAGGVVGLCPWSIACWTGGPNPPGLGDYLDHLEYVADRVGRDHVAVGTDSEATPGAFPPGVREAYRAMYPEVYDAFLAKFPDFPKTSGFETMEDLPNVTEGLLGRGWPEADIRKLLGENLLRVYAASWGGN